MYEVPSLNQGSALPVSPFGGDVVPESAAPKPSHRNNLEENAPLGSSHRRSLRADQLEQSICTGLLGKISRDGRLEVSLMMMSTKNLRIAPTASVCVVSGLRSCNATAEFSLIKVCLSILADSFLQFCSKESQCKHDWLRPKLTESGH